MSPATCLAQPAVAARMGEAAVSRWPGRPAATPAPPTILVSFCAQTKCADGAGPQAGLIVDASGNLFGTTTLGGAHLAPMGEGEGAGTVFEIAKTAGGYASSPKIL